MEHKEKVPYDKRSGEFVSRGCDYGVGKRQPVGSKKVSDKSAIPYGTHKVKENEKY